MKFKRNELSTADSQTNTYGTHAHTVHRAGTWYFVVHVEQGLKFCIVKAKTLDFVPGSP